MTNQKRHISVISACLCMVALSSCIAAGEGEAAYSSNFEDGKVWRVAEGIRAEVGSTDGRSALHIRQNQTGGWDFIGTDGFSLEVGKKYRLTALFLIRNISSGIGPYFKVVFLAREPDGQWEDAESNHSKRLGRARTDPYNLKSGGWQKMVVEFVCPKTATGGQIILERATPKPITMDAWIDDVQVVQIDEFSAIKAARFRTVPPALAARRNVHPRLYLTAERIAELKKKVRTEPYCSFLAEVREVADRGVKTGPPKYRAEKLPEGHSGAEQLWQRGVGNMMPYLAIMYVLTGEKKYLASATDWMLTSAAYPTWGLGRTDGTGLEAGHQLFGLALGYDWLYHDLDIKTRTAIRNCLQRRGRYMFEQLFTRGIWWHRAYLQNHQWVSMTGLSAAGMALYGEVENIDGWITIPLKKFKKTMASLGSDGASHEGVPYWSYGIEFMLKYMDLARDLLGEDLFKDNAWFKNTTSFVQYSMLGRNYWTRDASQMSFADAPRYWWYGPDYMLRKLAAEYRDGHAQWLADETDKAGVCKCSACFLNLLWYDPTVKPAPPTDLPTFKHFDDMGLVFMRSGWDGDESLFAFKCGPCIGHHAIKAFSYDPGAGHVHPDAGAFQLFAFGDWLIADDRYTFKETVNQNTALINGIGQIGEGSAWFSGTSLCAQSRGPKILRAFAGRDFDYIIGDVTNAYEDKAGLKKFLRHVFHIKPDCWIIVDEFEAKEPAKFELSFHSDFPFKPTGKGQYVAGGKKGMLRLTALQPKDVTAQAMKHLVKDPHGSDRNRKLDALVIANGKKRKDAVFITVIETAPAGGEFRITAQAAKTDRGQTLTIKTPKRTWNFILLTGQKDRSWPIFREKK
ncbi:MAG: DUF4962 domain-containing protein [Planctomycetota bacterium]|nr:DUF4962 domain-containing protein [Planctomycetota bacterium]